jgi:DNA invertase Pin-like site-specific DNA recombinase
MKKIIAYYRVSTKRQGQSGLGLEGQQAAVKAYASQNGAEIVKAYTEVESGKRSDRPELAKALGHAKLAGATLVVAKLDRLSRNVAFLAAVMDSGADFVAVDQPHANRLTLHILSAMAEAEAKAISDRTKVALAAVKARGKQLGSAREGHWQGREERREAGRQKAVARAATVRHKQAGEAYAYLMPTIRELRESGETLESIANKLNLDGHRTTRQLPFTGTMIHRLLRRAA